MSRFAPRRGVLAADTSSASTPSTGRRTWMSTGSSGPSSRPGGAGGRGTTRDSRARRPYTARYVGSLVADFHRTLLEGGIYLYPPEASRASGKLRLHSEAAPMAFLAQPAGDRKGVV